MNKQIKASLDEIVEAIENGLAPISGLTDEEETIIRTALERFVVEEEDRWISVDERLPEEGQLILTYCPEGETEGHKYYICKYINHKYATLKADSVEWIADYISWPITRWMPLPPAPISTEKGGEDGKP